MSFFTNLVIFTLSKCANTYTYSSFSNKHLFCIRRTWDASHSLRKSLPVKTWPRLRKRSFLYKFPTAARSNNKGEKDTPTGRVREL